MLSIEDIYHEIGKNIFICPIDTDNFRDNSIDLTASEFAWSSKGQYLYDPILDAIIVPPHETACILTRESIYITRKIGGTYHSRVSLVKQGFGHVGTMLDPEYCGQSLIMLHNLTDEEQRIDNIKQSVHGARIVSLVFYYLKTPISEKGLATPPGHLEKISKIDSAEIYKKWLEDNKWVNNPKNLKAHFKENYEKQFLDDRKIYSKRKNIASRFVNSFAGKLIIKYGIILIAIAFTYQIIITHFKPEQSSGWSGIIVALVIGVLGIIANDISGNARR